MQPRSLATINRILDGAAEVLRHLGHAGASTDAIALEAGVSVGSLYRYFDGKDDVLTTLFNHRAQMLMARLQSFEEDPTASFADNLSALLAVGATNTDLGPDLYHELNRIPGIDEQLVRLRQFVVDRIVE